VSEGAERRARRAGRAVGLSFFLLAPYLAVESLRDLFGGHDVTTNALALVVTAASLVVMPALGRAKQRLGARLNSEATSAEGQQNLMCAAQAGAVLIALAATATLGWSWLDPAIGLLLAGWAIYEGIQAWHGEDCC
jgi:divalent metal cation (Fe/Co/Zn/Cd) transporter